MKTNPDPLNDDGASPAVVTLMQPAAALPALAPPGADEPERTPEAVAEFQQDTETIRKYRHQFVETGLAITRIWNTRRFRWLGYKTMEEYLDVEWDLRPRQAQQLRAAAEVVRMLKADQEASNCSLFIPKNEGQARHITRLPSHEMRHHAATKLHAIKLALGKVTAEHVEMVCRQLRGLPVSAPAPMTEKAEAAQPAAGEAAKAAPAETAALPEHLPIKPRNQQMRETADHAIAWTAALKDMIGTPDTVEVAAAMTNAINGLDVIKQHYFEHRLRRS